MLLSILMLRGKKTQSKTQKIPDVGFQFILWNVPESFVLWVNLNNIMQLLKNKLNICTLGNKSQQNIFLLTLNFTIVKPEENNRVVK